MKRWLVPGLMALMFVAAVATAAATYGRLVSYGHLPGRWLYPYFRVADAAAILKVLPVALVLAAIPLALPRLLRRRWGWVVALALVCATGSHLVMRHVCRYPLANMVQSDGSNSFWTPARTHGAAELLGNFEEIVGTLPMHARSNMPGKILAYHALGLFTDSPLAVGVAILVLSNLGGLLLFAVVKRLFHDTETAYGALLLYLFLPARLCLVPTLNTLTPVLILAPLLLFLCHVETGKTFYLFVTGAALYGLLLFEPIPFLAGLVFVGVIASEWRRLDLSRIIVWTILGFVTVHGLMWCWVRYDVFHSFYRCLQDTIAFNEQARRPYRVWVVFNFKEFFLGFGGAGMVLLAAAAVDAVRRQRWDRHAWFFVSALAALLVADLLGVPRGETMRLWIFLMVLLVVPPAYYARETGGLALVGAACLAGVIQTTVALGEVAFVIP
jgi:hypothetical protein